MKAKIKEWLDAQYGDLQNTGSSGVNVDLVGMIEQCIQDITPQWVSVDDELPDPLIHNKVLATNGSYVFECEFDDGYWSNIGGDEMTHWKPAINLPK